MNAKNGVDEPSTEAARSAGFLGMEGEGAWDGRWDGAGGKVPLGDKLL